MTSEEELISRIIALGDQVLDIHDAWKLFDIPEFHCDDLDVTLMQADWALVQAKIELHKRRKTFERP